ncbi:MAG TPA: AI-2E family transporter [Brevibacterium senegalense]|uniref:AI-2E family transporter n=1 Tax=Brevibacterium senegalense TaxID=1033736 RepID=A0A921SQ02_9MICO|nr:AI-2E family transporter [Brevibacterium senegalense]
MANERRADFTQRIRGAWEGFRNLRDDAAQQPGGSYLGAPPTGPMTFTEPTEDELGRGAYEPYVSPPFRLAAAWSWRTIVILVAVGVLLWLLSQVSQVLLPALIALLLAALLSPIHSFLVRKGWPRALSAATVFIGFLLLVVGTIALVGQQIVVGFGALWTQVLAGVSTITTWLNSNPFGLDSSIIAQYLDQGLDQGLTYLEENASNLLGGAAGAVSSVGSFATGTLLALVAAFFFLYDGRNMFNWAVRLMPSPARARTEGAALRGWQTLVQYVRVQIIVAAVDAIGIGIGALAIGIPLAIPLTLLVFLGSFIPIVGAVVTGAIAVIVALVSQGFIPALIMLGVVLLVQQIEGNVLQPFIMGKAVSVHPLAVILTVAAGGFLFGIVGALFAVPLIAVVNTVVRYLAGDDVFAGEDAGVAADVPDEQVAEGEADERTADGSSSREKVGAAAATSRPAAQRDAAHRSDARDADVRDGGVRGTGVAEPRDPGRSTFGPEDDGASGGQPAATSSDATAAGDTDAAGEGASADDDGR